MEHYYILSTKYSIQERQTKKHGKVYDGIFRVITMDGRERQKKLSGYPSKTALKEAHAHFITTYCELVKNNPLRNADGEKKTTATFGELYTEYLLAQNNQVKDSSLYEKQKFYRNYFQAEFENKRITELTKAYLIDWQDRLWSMRNPRTGQFYSYKYLTNIRSYLHTFLAWVEYKYDIPNQLAKVKRPKRRVAKTPMKFWKTEEFKKFIAVVDNPTFKTMFTMLFYTGRRRGEVIALHAHDVESNRICFDKTCTRKTTDGSKYKITSTKNEKRDYTIICEPLQNALQTYTPQEPFYFGGENPMHENTLSHAFKRYIALAGVKEIRLHDLRHSFVSMCIHLNASVYTIADLIGDTPEQILKTYGHLYEEDKQKIIAQIK